MEIDMAQIVPASELSAKYKVALRTLRDFLDSQNLLPAVERRTDTRRVSWYDPDLVTEALEKRWPQPDPDLDRDLELDADDEFEGDDEGEVTWENIEKVIKSTITTSTAEVKAAITTSVDEVKDTLIASTAELQRLAGHYYREQRLNLMDQHQLVRQDLANLSATVASLSEQMAQVLTLLATKPAPVVVPSEPQTPTPIMSLLAPQPAPAPVAAVTESKVASPVLAKPRVVVANAHPRQVTLLRREFGDVLELRFLPLSDCSSKPKVDAARAWGLHFVVWVNGRMDLQHLRAVNAINVEGGITRLRAALTEILDKVTAAAK